MTIAKSITKTLDISVEDVRVDLTATIRSYDLTDTRFIFEIKSSNETTVNLTGSTAMYIVEYVHNSQTYAIQGDINIIGTDTLSFNLPEDLKGYSGTVLIGIYVKLTDGTKIDIKDIAVRIEPSIMDKDIDFSAKTYFKDFESVKAEVILEGEKAKTSIKQVLPSVQAEISEIKTEIENLPDIPDLFVAYADSADGIVGFSKIKPSENLLSNGDFRKGFTDVSIMNGDKSVGTIEFVNFKGKQCIKLTDVDFWNISKYVNLSIGNQNGKTRTLEFDVLNQNGSLCVDDGVEMFEISSTSSNFVRYKKVITSAYNRDRIAFYGNKTKVTCYLTNFALHDGDVEIQPFLPSRVDNYRDSFAKYIGYSVKNSTNPSYYRWQVNPEWQRAQLEYEKASMIQDKLVNLIPNADFTQGLNRWFKSAGVNSLNINRNYLTIVKNEGQSGAIGVYTNASEYMTKGNKYYISADFRSTEGYYGVFLFDGQTINRPSDVDVSTFHKYSKLIVPDTDFTIRFYVFNNQTYDMRKPALYDLTSIFGKGNEPSLEEFERLLAINVNSPTIYSQSVSKAKLNSSPVNSILTTLSSENPSTTLGGTWTQLGTETKFSNTIYYWKRTN